MQKSGKPSHNHLACLNSIGQGAKLLPQSVADITFFERAKHVTLMAYIPFARHGRAATQAEQCQSSLNAAGARGGRQDAEASQAAFSGRSAC